MIVLCSGPIIDFKVACNHLIVITRTQCHIFHVMNLKSETVIDTKNIVCLASMGPSNFAVVGNDGIVVYSYSGRKLSSFQHDYLKLGAKSQDSLSVTSNVLALIDSSDHKVRKIITAEIKTVQKCSYPFLTPCRR